MSKLACCIVTILFLAAMVVPFWDLNKVFAQDRVIGTIPVETSPIGVAYNAKNGDMYVTNFDSGTVSVIDSSTNTVTKTIPVGTLPRGVAYNGKNGDMYVANEGSGTVSVIDSSTNTVTKTIPVGTRPSGVAYNGENGDMYVADQNSATVSVIDSGTNTVTTTITGMSGPFVLAYNAKNGDMYVVNRALDTVSVIDSSTNTVTTTISGVENNPLGIAYNGKNDNMYVTIQGSSKVSVIDSVTNEVTTILTDVRSPQNIAYNEGNDNMYFTMSPNIVSVIDSNTNKIIETITVENRPNGLAYNPDNGNMYVANILSNTVSVISTGTLQAEPPTATTITSATDSNGNRVQDKSSTVSTSITFQATATKGTNNIAGFECSLDNSAFSNCATSNPATIKYDNLATDKKHTFQVRAVDTQGNTDPKPAGFEWTVLTPTQAITKLQGTINDMHLSKGTTTSLQGPLNSAIKQLDRNNQQGACGPIGAFLDQVNDKRSSGQLTSAQAAELRQQATAIQQQIGCTTTASASAGTANSQSNSPLENMIDSALSNVGPTHSEQTDKARDTIHKGLDLYSDFFGSK